MFNQDVIINPKYQGVDEKEELLSLPYAPKYVLYHALENSWRYPLSPAQRWFL